MTTLLLISATLGHALFWAGLVNRLHGTAIRQRTRKIASGAFLLLALGLPIVVAAALATGEWQASLGQLGWAAAAAWGYVYFSAVMFVVGTVNWIFLRFHPERRNTVLSNHTTSVAVRNGPLMRCDAELLPNLVSRVPFNQTFEIRIHEKDLAIPGLAAAFEGLRIAHLSDLHMSGRVPKEYFEQVADAVNEIGADLIAVTGDIVELEVCLPWARDVLGRLRAKHGVYFVLGNHDRRVGFDKAVGALTDAGLEHVGGKWRSVPIGGETLRIAGNELPWFGPASDMAEAPDPVGRNPLNLLLAHSPDQFGWARERGFQLVLAGHNHGGQICLPLVGPILSPSRHGVRYAAGTFRRGGTVLHVSRGVSALTPLRLNCPPEVAILTLRVAT